MFEELNLDELLDDDDEKKIMKMMVKKMKQPTGTVDHLIDVVFLAIKQIHKLRINELCFSAFVC